MSLGSNIARTGVMIHGGENLYVRDSFNVLPWFQVTSSIEDMTLVGAIAQKDSSAHAKARREA